MKGRRRRPTSHRTDRWVVSYADFITLLFAFFLVLFAAAQSDHAAPTKVSNAVQAALGSKPPIHQVTASAPPPETELQRAFTQLCRDLQSLRESGGIRMHMEKRGLVVSLSQAAYFPSGGDQIEPHLRPSILKIADSVRAIPNRILLEGHTDSTPLRARIFRDNWDLSAARASAMLRVLTDDALLERSRMSIAGYADTQPLASEETAEGRSQNRRVDIVILGQ